MNKVVVVTDSVSCLPRELVEKYGIRIVPISIIIDGKPYRDGIDITPSEVYKIVRENKTLPTTTSPSPGDFLSVYREIHRENASGIVCVTICSEISMMYDSAVQAKQMAEEEMPGIVINVIDSRTAGGAEGFIALAAAEAAASGQDMARVCDAAEKMKPRVNMIAVLDTLEYLARAGRIPRAASWVTSMLKIKPILTFSQGGIKPLERARTKPKAVQRLIDIMKERMNSKPVRVNVMHANVPEEAEALRQRVEAEFNCIELFVADFAPTMGVQAGPGVLALAFYSEEDNDVG